MKSFREFERLFIHRRYVDMRKSINGLAVIVQEEMRFDLKSRSLFIFCNRRRTHMKILYFDKNRFCLWFARLEQGKFPWPKDVEDEVITISEDDMELLLDGVNFWTRFKKVSFEKVV